MAKGRSRSSSCSSASGSLHDTNKNRQSIGSLRLVSKIAVIVSDSCLDAIAEGKEKKVYTSAISGSRIDKARLLGLERSAGPARRLK